MKTSAEPGTQGFSDLGLIIIINGVIYIVHVPDSCLLMIVPKRMLLAVLYTFIPTNNENKIFWVKNNSIHECLSFKLISCFDSLQVTSQNNSHNLNRYKKRE